MTIIGQERLKETLNKYTINTLPKTLLFIGPFGCGKHLFATQLANRLGLEISLLNENVTEEQLIEYSHNPIKTLYIIDLAKFTEKQQNQFLKFIEEPADSVYVILTATSELGILPTILNRCIIHTFEDYSVDDLKQFEWLIGVNVPDIVFKVCQTPGRLTGIDPEQILSLQKTCIDLVETIKNLTYAECMSKSVLINYKENYSKFDLDLFINMLELVSFDLYINKHNELAYDIYKLTKEYKQRLIIKAIIKENFVLSFLTALWKGTR